MATASAFGAWGSEAGLPVFLEAIHPDDPACTWDPIVSPPTNRHWCAVGNRRLQVVSDNFATTAIRDTARGFRWLTPSGPGTGATVVREADGSAWATDKVRWPSSWSGTGAPVRTWGPTWTTIAGEHDGLRIERTVACPEGDDPWVLVQVVLTSAAPRIVLVAEEWHFTAAGEALVDDHGVSVLPGAPATGHGPSGCIRLSSPTRPDRVEVDEPVGAMRAVRLECDLDLRSGEPVTWWVVVGLLDGVPEPSDPARLWMASLDALRDRLPAASCPAVPALDREVPWHVALLTGGAGVDAVLGGHTLDQGSAYSFDLAFNGAARDPLQHALPLVYTEPDLALSVLRNTCAWAGPDGALPYGLDAEKLPIREWFDPSDQALWALWLAAEYGAATGDLAAFRAPAPFHPVYETEPVPVVNHLVGQYRHLLDVVSVGEHGHIRICNADWNDSALTLAGIDPAVMRERGESVLNSAMAAWVLPRFAGLLRRLGDPALEVIADEAEERAAVWRELVASEWNGRWYRRARGPNAVVGDDDLWLEVQPWAILCGAADDARSCELLATINDVVRRGSPLGARVRGPAPITVPEGRTAGEGSAGGVWFSINMTLAWAAARFDPDLAWDELRRMTLDAHVAEYPNVWEGTLSGPDAYNTPESPRPGRTWAWPARGIGMQSFPVNNLHCHSQVLLTYLRLLGVEPTEDGSLHVGATRHSSFTSRVLRVGADGHGSVSSTGPVRLITPTGRAEGTGLVSW